jgi:hypothetical protein
MFKRDFYENDSRSNTARRDQGSKFDSFFGEDPQEAVRGPARYAQDYPERHQTTTRGYEHADYCRDGRAENPDNVRAPYPFEVRREFVDDRDRYYYDSRRPSYEVRQDSYGQREEYPFDSRRSPEVRRQEFRSEPRRQERNVPQVPPKDAVNRSDGKAFIDAETFARVVRDVMREIDPDIAGSASGTAPAASGSRKTNVEAKTPRAASPAGSASSLDPDREISSWEDRFLKVSESAEELGADVMREMAALDDRNAALLRRVQLQDRCLEGFKEAVSQLKTRISGAKSLDHLKQESLADFALADKAFALLKTLEESSATASKDSGAKAASTTSKDGGAKAASTTSKDGSGDGKAVDDGKRSDV